MKLSEIIPGMHVAYIPSHAHGNLAHPDVERMDALKKKMKIVLAH